jgi:pyruvate carboxylase
VLTRFVSGALFVEQYMTHARHIEVQLMGDATGEVVHFFERDCSVQMNNQKVVEIAPARGIHPLLRQRLTNAAVRLAKSVKVRS